MEKMKKSHSIRQSFIMGVSVTMLIVFLIAAITVLGCYYTQKLILPDSQEIWLHIQTTKPDGTVSEAKQRFVLDEPAQMAMLVPAGKEDTSVSSETQYTIEKIESSFSTLTPKKKVLYRSVSVCMFALPLFYSVFGIGICAWWFYRKKLLPPIRILSDATNYISEQNLDFIVDCHNEDELGQLCVAFEKMRRTLYDNNRRIWNMMEERRILQASVAHDLRNPISIIAGYVEYLQQSLNNGNLDREKLEHILSTLAITAKRMERYTDYIRDLSTIEETDMNYSSVKLPDFLKNATDSLDVMAEQHHCQVVYVADIPECQIKLDEEIFYRIIENIFSNALRYAKSQVSFEFSLADKVLSVCIKDDGKGFSKKMLRKQDTLFYSEDTTEQHLGLGLATSRILSQKHGGSIELSNAVPNGACVVIKLLVLTE
ncbi:MAG: HAMP domain-containing sensor histidine kinase [Eubacteriales bacterium]|nr:HAMP domain-containing sensor histidine kinase [Eubacteriales bacterium]